MQSSVELQRVLGVTTFGNGRITHDVERCNIIIGNRCGDCRRTAHRQVTTGCRARVGDRNGEGFGAFDQSVIDRRQFDAQVVHRISIAGKSQRRSVKGKRAWTHVIHNR